MYKNSLNNLKNSKQIEIQGGRHRAGYRGHDHTFSNRTLYRTHAECDSVGQRHMELREEFRSTAEYVIQTRQSTDNVPRCPAGS